MNILDQFSDNVIVTMSKKDLVDLVNQCLTTASSQRTKVLPDLFTIKQLAAYIGYSTPTIYKMVADAIIPCYKLGGKLLFRRSYIDDWLLDFEQPTIKARIAELNNKCR